VIVDDEPLAREALRALIEREADFVVDAECGDGFSAANTIRSHKPDLVFLDIEMPGSSGFDLLPTVGNDAVPVVVFVTAYDQYAVKAFEAHALDYLLKPFSDARFREVLARARRSLNIASPSGDRRHVVVRDGRRTLVIPWTEIDWVEAEDYYVRIHAGRDHPLVRRSLRDLMASLDPEMFVRVHRSTIVNRERVREVRSLPTGDSDITLSDGTTVRMSRTFRTALSKRLGA